MKRNEYSPFQMKAKGFNNSPMQKNFGSQLAMNKGLDNSSVKDGRAKSSALQVKMDTKKLSRADMEGGLTGAPSTGELDGPMRNGLGDILSGKGGMGALDVLKNQGLLGGGSDKDDKDDYPKIKIGKNKPGPTFKFWDPSKSTKKPGVVSPGKFNSPANKAKRAEFRDDIKSFGKGLRGGLAQFGNQLKRGGDKVISNVKTKKPLFSGTALGSKKKTSTTKKKSTTALGSKPKTSTTGNILKNLGINLG